MSEAPTNSQVKRAGRIIRSFFAHESPPADPATWDEFHEAVGIIQAHRATFRTPLVTANNSLRSMVRTLGLNGQVTQRLKRMQTIMNKLVREQTLALDRMQDTGHRRLPRRLALPGRRVRAG